MTFPDYELHLDDDRFDALFGEGSSEAEAFAFGEDTAELDRLIEEELGPPRRRGRPRSRLRN